MKKITAIHILLLAASLAASICSCGTRKNTFEPTEVLYAPRHAAGFTIYRAGEHSTAIRITDPWQGADGVQQWVFVSGEGEYAPAGFTGTVLAGAPRRIVCMSSSYVAFWGELDASDRIVGVSGADLISDSLVRARWHAGDIADVGYDASLDLERLASLNPDLMLVYGVKDAGGGVTDKLSEMGVPYVFVGDYLEESPLARAEWIVALGAMLGETADAEEKFGAIERSYDELRSSTAEFPDRPEVMLNAPYRDVWYAPGDDNYLVRFIRDAGGEYVLRGTAGRDSRPIDIEEAYVAMQRADLWLNTNHYSTLAALLADNPRFAETPPVREGGVYNNNARMTASGGSDFWESGVVRPDVILRDLIHIIHPELSSDTSLYYYKKLE